MADLTTETAGSALMPVAAMLEADGYGLAVDVAGQTLRLTVTAGPSACADCLVPKPVFARVVESALVKAGHAADSVDIQLAYPI